MSHSKTFFGRPSIVLVPPLPSAKKIRKNLHPLRLQDRSKEAKLMELKTYHRIKISNERRAIRARKVAIQRISFLLMCLFFSLMSTSFNTVGGDEVPPYISAYVVNEVVIESRVLGDSIYIPETPEQRTDLTSSDFREIDEVIVEYEQPPIYFLEVEEYYNDLLIEEELYYPDYNIEEYVHIEYTPEVIEYYEVVYTTAVEEDSVYIINDIYIEYTPDYIPLIQTPPILSPDIDNVAIVWNFFIERGFSPQATAGIIGNLQQEASPQINPMTVGDTRLATQSYGIAQWREGRLADLRSFANSMGRYWRELEVQLLFMYQEMSQVCMGRRFSGERTNWHNYMSNVTNKGATAVDGLYGFKNITCVENAVRLFDAVYHRSGIPNFPRRINFAHEAFNRFN